MRDSPRREYYAQYYTKHKEKLLATTRKWQKDNPERHRANMKRAREEVKRLCIEHYGGKCACCSETILGFLTIDHIAQNGAEHRKEIRNYNIYYWLKLHNFPEGYQVLCYNCNCGRWHNNGVCPHLK